MNVVSRIAAFSCPSCGGHIGEAAPIEQVRQIVTPPAQRLIFDLLARTVGAPVMRDVIMDRMYGGRRDGGPDTGDSVLKVHVCQLRRRIEPYGWTISNSKGGAGQLAHWRLIPTIKSA